MSHPSRSFSPTPRALIALALTLALAIPLGGLASTPARAAAPDDDLRVTAYALPSATDNQVRRMAGELDTLTIVGVSLRPSGARLSRVPDGSRRLRRLAHRLDLRTELLVNNYSNRLGEFDPRALHRMLAKPQRRNRVANALARQVRRGGWGGVNVDMERVRAADAPGLVALVRRLHRLLPDRATLSIDVSARTSLRAYRRAGYRLGPIARYVDLVQLMAYDQHGPTWSGPGPIGALSWQRAALRSARERVPARKLDLGVAGYGYTWPRKGRGRSITDAGARNRVQADGASAQWRKGAGEWTATLSDDTVLWWSDRRSIALRRTIAEQQGLHGIAVWRLGSVDGLR